MTIGGHTLTRLPPDCDPGVGTLSRNAGEGLVVARIKLLSRTAGEGDRAPSPSLPRARGREGWGLVGEGLR